MYGVNERQFRRLFLMASKSDEITGIAFFKILESRLDNLVYRMGFATTRAQARQLVNHGHILVNGKKIDIPSYLCKVNDVISLKEGSKDLAVVKAAIEATPAVVAYVSRDVEKNLVSLLDSLKEMNFHKTLKKLKSLNTITDYCSSSTYLKIGTPNITLEFFYFIVKIIGQ